MQFLPWYNHFVWTCDADATIHPVGVQRFRIDSLKKVSVELLDKWSTIAEPDWLSVNSILSFIIPIWASSQPGQAVKLRQTGFSVCFYPYKARSSELLPTFNQPADSSLVPCSVRLWLWHHSHTKKTTYQTNWDFPSCSKDDCKEQSTDAALNWYL